MEENKPQEEPKPVTMVESAHQAAEKLKLENERMEKNISRLEELNAMAKLGGTTDAGVSQAKPEDELKKEMAQKFWEGTAIGESVKKHG